ncbi:MAG: TonB-dependent receptor [Sphingobium sp.]
MHKAIITLASSTALLAMGSQMTMAQESSVPEGRATENDGGDIIVTAKTGQPLKNAPVSAVSLSARELERLDIQSVQDAQIRLPSLVYDSSGGSAQVYIRGIGTNSAYAGLESSVGTYIDGVYLQRQVGAAVDIVDVRSIDVLNGPQGSLYGRNATGGVILVNTNDPEDRTGGRLRFDLGRFGRKGGEAMLNLPLSQDVALRLAGGFQHQGGFITNVVNGDRLGGFDRGTARAKLRWRASDRLTITLTGEYQEQRADPPARRTLTGAPECTACAIYGTTPPDGFYEVGQTPTRNMNIRSIAGTLNLRYEGDAYEIVSVTGVRDFRYRIFVDQDLAEGDLYNSRAEEFGTTYTQDAYIRTKFGGAFDFLAGVSGEKDKDSLLIAVFGSAFGPFQGAGGTSTVKLSSISPYGEFYIRPLDGLTLTLGGRYNIDRKRLRAVNNDGALAAFGGVPLVTQSETYKDFTPRAVISYKGPTYTLYASYSRGAKSGGFNTPAFTPLLPLNSEKLDSFEIGFKGGDADGRLSLNAAAFYYDYRDIQVSFVDATTGGIRAENAANARVYGAELNVVLKMTDRLTLAGGGLLSSARFKNYPSAAVYCPRTAVSPAYFGCPAPDGEPGLASGRADLAGKRLPRAPEATLYGSIEYRQPVADNWEATLSITDRYTSDYDFLPAAGGPLALSKQNAFHLLSASVAIAQLDSGFDIRLFGENLAKARYYLEVPTSAFGAAGTAAMPRTYGMSIGYRF